MVIQHFKGEREMVTRCQMCGLVLTPVVVVFLGDLQLFGPLLLRPRLILWRLFLSYPLCALIAGA